MSTLLLLLTYSLYALSLWGWGSLVTDKNIPAAFQCILGLGIALVLGGWLNLATLAFPLSLDILLIIGWGLSSFSIWKSRSNLLSRWQSDLTHSAVYWILPSLLFIYVAFTQTFPSTFNPHDDFEKYFSHPLRMLATGTIASGYFDAMGTQTLGGMGFLHAFPVALFGIQTINSVDAVFGFGLCVFSIASLARHFRLGVIGTLPLIAFFLIPPMQVNVSAIYISAAVYIAIFGLLTIKISSNTEQIFDWKMCAIIGLCYASLVSLKTIHALFIPIHFLCLLTGLMFSRYRLNSICKIAARIVSLSLLFWSPWFLIHLDKFIRIGRVTIDPAEVVSHPQSDLLKEYGLFSIDPVFYGFGASINDYTIAVFVVAFLSFGFLILTKDHPQQRTALCSIIGGSVVYVVMVAVLERLLMGAVESVRYAMPLILSSISVGIIYLLHLLKELPVSPQQKILRIATLTGCAVLVFNFIPTLFARSVQLHNYGSTNALVWFSKSPFVFRNWTDQAFSVWTKWEFKAAQTSVPKGKNLLIWTQTTHLTDYHHNNVTDLVPAGLATPWLGYPFSSDLDAQIQYLTNQGIEYFMYQHNGIPFRNKENLFTAYTAHFDNQYNVASRLYLFMSSIETMVDEPNLAEIVHEGQMFRVLKFNTN